MASIIEILKNSPAIGEAFIRTKLRIRTSIMVYREQNYCMKCPVSHNEQGVYTGNCLANNGGCGCTAAMKTSQNQVPCPKGFFACDWFKPELFKAFLKDNPIKKP